MGEAKKIVIAPVSKREADEVIKRLHYSGKVVRNSQINIGVFYNGELLGALQFGPPLDKRKALGIVAGTEWNNMIELNRMALDDSLPRNGESRVIAMAAKILNKRMPSLKWILSYSDATQCGDGTIYRASGFVLTGIKKNSDLLEINGVVTHKVSLASTPHKEIPGTGVSFSEAFAGKSVGASTVAKTFGGNVLAGYQLRYVLFLDPTWRNRLVPSPIPFDEIGADVRMYKGKKRP